MAYELLQSRTGEYAVDWGVVERLVRSYWRSRYQYEYSEVKTESAATWNPLSRFLPEVKHVDVPWCKVREYAETQTINAMIRFKAYAAGNMKTIAGEVEALVGAGAKFKRYFTDYLKDVQQENSKSIEGAVGTYEGLISAAKFIRDTSTDVVAIGSTIATGGAAVGLLELSSALKGVYKYQDTGSVGAATLYGLGSLFAGAFKLGGAKLTGGQEAVLIIFQGTLEGNTSLIAGDTWQEAVEKGALKIASSGAATSIFSSKAIKGMFERMSLPFKLEVQDVGGDLVFKANKVVEELVEKGGPANDFVKGLAKKGTEKLAKPGAKAGASWAIDQFRSHGAKESPESTARSCGLVDEALLHDQMLLQLAIVNQKLGIGRGW